LIRTNLTESEVRPHLRALTDACFKNVPSGVGEGGLVKISRQDLSKMATDGIEWSVGKGYAWPEDPDQIEAKGRLPDADFSRVSDRATTRGKDQVGSLGAGNHFVEIQKVDRVYDERAAKAFGLESVGSVAIMVHTGSRGFGHQIATDYIDVCERVVKREKIELPDLQLACAPIGSKEGQDYWKAMCCGANFAWNNRQLITFGVRNAFADVLGRPADALGMGIVYDVCHNIGKVAEGRDAGLFAERGPPVPRAARDLRPRGVPRGDRRRGPRCLQERGGRRPSRRRSGPDEDRRPDGPSGGRERLILTIKPYGNV